MPAAIVTMQNSLSSPPLCLFRCESEFHAVNKCDEFAREAVNLQSVPRVVFKVYLLFQKPQKLRYAADPYFKSSFYVTMYGNHGNRQDQWPRANDHIGYLNNIHLYLRLSFYVSSGPPPPNRSCILCQARVLIKMTEVAKLLKLIFF